MSSHEIMDFDLFVGRTAPLPSFGPVDDDSKGPERQLRAAAAQVRQQVRDTFDAKLENSSAIPGELDSIIRELWETGWDPQVDNLQLFTRDFGLLLTETTLDLLGGKLVPRSPDNVVHWSIFWADRKVEAFPFHKALKCLTHRDGETMTYFVRGLRHQLEVRE